MTSAPNGCWRLSIERTATGVPVARSSSVATTVVVPRSKAMRVAARGGVAGLERDQHVVDDDRRDLPVRAAQRARQRRAARAARCAASRSSSASSTRSDVAALVGQRRLLELQVALLTRPGAGSPGGRRRPSPPWAALPAAARRRRGRLVGLRAAGQPPAVAQLVGREDARRRASSPAGRRRRCGRGTSCRCRGAPQVESIATPFQDAASNSVTPGGTRTSTPLGSKRSRTRAGAPTPASVGSTAVTPPPRQRHRRGGGGRSSWRPTRPCRAGCPTRAPPRRSAACGRP